MLLLVTYHSSLLADVEISPSITTLKRRNPKAFRPLSPPPQLSNITAPQPRPKHRKTKVPYVDTEQSSQKDTEIGNYSDMDEGMLSSRYQHMMDFL